ncbi:Phox-like protein [Suillus subalutaceus]|uniref:Phox-like protein n=1 Tax=Suillus subalutaceus TaxID=48586 RepID=UPI001B861E21|nr:Phox-like protein [Suillus subalutaceus]KAG1835004.1 Phox-like protein [Suillus subalutaceus]
MPAPTHPFRNTESLLVVIPDDGIDVEAEARLYDELCDVRSPLFQYRPKYLTDHHPGSSVLRPSTRPKSPQGPPSIFSRDIWLNDNSGTSLAFARNVHIAGWDEPGGAYVVYDCVIRTKEGTTIHAHKRYSDFVLLYDALKHSLPSPVKHQHIHPSPPPEIPFSRYRAAFVDRRRRTTTIWLSAVLLHPEIGACQSVRWWVMD